ncbi:hypothetical protein ACFLXT_01530 [Chloroflexota bacterium]
MEKEQFDKMVKLLEELNANIGNISSRLSGLDSNLELLKDELSKWVRLMTVR